MNIIFYTNDSPDNEVTKTLTQQYSATGELHENCSIINPVITCEVENVTAAKIPLINYAYISDFGRYYFVRNITFIGKLVRFDMHVDVLSSFATELKNHNAIVARQQNKYNLYLQDGMIKTYANPHIEIKQFPGAFTEYEFIFSVVG